MANLKHHPTMFLRGDAAAAINKAEDERGVLRISSAGRTLTEQQTLINRWNAGGRRNRPPYLYQPAAPAATSNHVDNGGEAIDTPDFNRFNDYSEAYGFKQTYPKGDPVHFDFVGTVTLPAGGTALPYSEVVKLEQSFLNTHRGEKLTVDGLKGPATRAAYGRYQTFLRAYGYTGRIDNVWGPGQQAAHAKYYAQVAAPRPPAPAPAPASNLSNGGRPAIARGAKGPLVGHLQRILNQKYPAYSKLSIDNDFGRSTERVVREFQRRAGLSVDGVAGPRTWNALGQ